jgi:hypothetical protein
MNSSSAVHSAACSNRPDSWRLSFSVRMGTILVNVSRGGAGQRRTVQPGGKSGLRNRARKYEIVQIKYMDASIR